MEFWIFVRFQEIYMVNSGRSIYWRFNSYTVTEFRVKRISQWKKPSTLFPVSQSDSTSFLLKKSPGRRYRLIEASDPCLQYLSPTPALEILELQRALLSQKFSFECATFGHIFQSQRGKNELEWLACVHQPARAAAPRGKYIRRATFRSAGVARRAEGAVLVSPYSVLSAGSLLNFWCDIDINI